MAAATIELAFKSADAEVRRRATSMLTGVPLADALTLLLAALGDADWRVRKEATLAARAFGAAPALVSALVGVLGTSDDVGLRNAVSEVLAAAGRGATAALAEALSRLDADGRKLVVETLGRGRDPEALGALSAALDDRDDNVRQSAVEAIAALGSLARERVERLLLERLDDRDPVVQLTALEGLTALGVGIRWERLSPLLDDPTLRAAALAAAALTESPQAPGALASALVGARGKVFDLALKGLSRLAEGPLATSVAAALVASGPELGRRLVAEARAEEPDADARRSAALWLAAISGAEGVVDVALSALAEELLSETAQRALLAVGVEALPALIARLFAASPLPEEARAVLVDVIAELALSGPSASDAARSAMRRAARDPAQQVAVRALLALSQLGEARDLEMLAELTLVDARALSLAAEGALSALSARFPEDACVLSDRLSPNERSLLPAAIAVGAAGVSSSLRDRDAAFLAHAATAGDSRARRAAVHAVSEVRAVAAFPAAMDVLRIALADEEHVVQTEAARALGRLCSTLGAPRVSDVLELVERTGEADLVAAAVRAIGEGLVAGPRGAAGVLVSALSGLARDAPSPVAIAAVEALSQAERAGAPHADEGLSSAFDHVDDAVVKAALLKLGSAPTALALAALDRGLAHASAAVRALAAEMLSDREPEEALPRLVKQLSVEPERWVKEIIQRALGRGEGGA